MSKENRVNNLLQIDKTSPWGFFDNASQGNLVRSDVGCVLFTLDAITFPFKLGLGMHSINWEELKDLAPLLGISLEKGLEGLQVFGDSELKIDWEKGK